MSRKKERDAHITTPEQLDGFLRVIKPPMWVTILAVFGVVLAITIWAFLYNMSLTVNNTGYVANHRLVMIADGNNIKFISVGQQLKIGDEVTHIDSIEKVSTEGSRLVITEESEAEESYAVSAPTEKSDGVYEVSVMVDGISPIEFLFD